MKQRYNYVDKVLARYRLFLRTRHLAHHDRFLHLERADKEAAITEAVIYFILTKISSHVDIFEHQALGGPDFQFESKRGRILAEATCLHESTVQDASGIDPRRVEGAGSFSPLTTKLLWKVFDKSNSGQLSGKDLPLILCIASRHTSGSILFGRTAARDFLTGDPRISFTVGQPPPNTHLSTPLENSAFFRLSKSGNREPCRRDISAIFLVHIATFSANVVALLHPDAFHPVTSTMFPAIPCVYVSNWPASDGNLAINWTGPSASKTGSHCAEFLY